MFHTVQEAARILRVDAATLYRAIREDAFPAVRVRTRYVVPAAVLDALVDEAAARGGCVDVARMTTDHRAAREFEGYVGGSSR